MQNCECKVTLGRVHDNLVSFLLVSSNLSYKHNCNFVRADACNISSIQASRYQKMGLRDINFCGLGFSWMISTAIFMLKLFDKERSHRQFLWQSYCLLCLSIICACYTSVTVKICCGARPQHHGAARRQRKLTVTLLIMTIVSVLLWIPYAIATFVFHTTDSIRSLSYTKGMRLNMSLLLLFYTNSFVNPVVYTIRMRKFRKALLLLFPRRRRQNAAVIPLQAR